jgi:hypothetical protein
MRYSLKLIVDPKALVFKVLVSRAGLEPATTALKVRIRGYSVPPPRHAHYRGVFALVVQVSALLTVKTGKDAEEDAVQIEFVASLRFSSALSRGLPSLPVEDCTNPPRHTITIQGY